MIEIVQVKDRRGLDAFVNFPDDLFRNDPLYVPPIRKNEKHVLTESPVLAYTEISMWLAYRDGKLCGRIACFINSRYNSFHNASRARFGWWDTVNDYEVSAKLFDTAVQWARERGMTQIHGPLALNTMGRQGLVVFGNGSEPQSSNLYNPSYYVDIVEKYGFRKELDWIQYRLDASQGVPASLERISGMLMKRYGFRFLDLSTVRADSPVVTDFFRKMNEAFSSVPNFIPFTDSEIAEMAKEYVTVLDSRYSCIVLDSNDEVVTFGICIPSLNKAYRKARGRMFPTGWYHLLKALKGKCDTIDLMLVGSAEKWVDKGTSAIFHKYLADSFLRNGVKYAITNPQIETNNALNVWDRYHDKELYIRRRCYVMEI